LSHGAHTKPKDLAIYRDDSFARGRGYPRVPDPTGVGMGSKFRPRVRVILSRAANGLQPLPAGIPATRVKIEKGPYVSMYGPTHLPNPRTSPVFPTPIPTRDPAVPSPLFFPKQAAAHLPRWCWNGGWRRSGSVAALYSPDGGCGHAAHLGGRHLLAPGGRSAPRVFAPSSLAPPRHAGVAAPSASRSSYHHQFNLFIL
jgi:hypothetical protein